MQTVHLPRAQATQPVTGQEEFIECELEKPLGIKFGRGNDGGAYVITVDPNIGNVDERVQVCFESGQAAAWVGLPCCDGWGLTLAIEECWR